MDGLSRAGSSVGLVLALTAALLGCSPVDSPVDSDNPGDSPANVRATWDATSVVLVWDAVPGADYYRIYHDSFFASSCDIWSGRARFCDELASIVTDTLYVHSSPDLDENYYWVVACDSSGCSPIDSHNSVQPDPRGPGDAPTNVRATWDATSVILIWDAVPDADYYRIYHDNFHSSSCDIWSGRARFCDELASSVTDTLYVHSSPDLDENYYWVVACDNSGCSPIDSDNSVQPDPEGAPTNVIATWDATSVVLVWDAVPGADYYKVYHNSFFSSDCEFWSGHALFCDELASSVPGTRYVHSSPDLDQNYYWVVACDNSGCSPIDSDNPAQPDPRGRGPGGALTNVIATWDATSVVLVWDAVPGADYYKVYHDSSFFSSGCDIRSGRALFCDELASSVPGTRYVHSSPDLDQNYYWVVACDNSGCSPPDSDNPTVSNQAGGMARATTVVRIIAGGTSRSLRLSIGCHQADAECLNGVTHYELSRSATAISNYQVIDSTVAGGHYVDSGLEPETTYFYMARACDSSECSHLSRHVGGITEAEGAVDIPSIPQGLVGEKEVRWADPDDARIWWNPVPGATHYRIYQSGSLDDTVFAPSTSYYDNKPNETRVLFLFKEFRSTEYSVAACNKAGCSERSESVVIS